MQNNSLSLLMFASAMGSLFLSLYAFKSRKYPAMFNLALLLMAATVWTLGYSLELASTNLQTMKLFNTFAYLGIATIPVLWLIFVARYTGNDGWLTPLNTTLLFIIPSMSILLVATNDLHYLFYSLYEMELFGVFSFPRTEPGLFWWVHVTYSYLAIITGLWYLGGMYFKVHRANRFAVGMFIAGLLLPYIANIAYVAGFKPYGFLDITPIAFIAMGVILIFGTFVKRVMDVTPLAYDLLFKNIPDIILVVDTQGKIINTNPAAQKLLDYESNSEVSGDNKSGPITTGQNLAALSDASEIALNGRTYTVSNTPILSPGSKALGRLIVLHDVTERKKAIKELTEKEHLQQLLITIAKELVNVPLHEVDEVIYGMLGKIGLFSGLDRVFVFHHDYSRKITINTHEWCAAGIPSEIENLQAVPFVQMEKILATHQRRNIFIVPRVTDMPEGDSIRRILEPQGILSTLLLPLMHKDKNIGFVGFDAVREEKEFSESEITLLSIFAELIVNIEVRRKSDQALRESEQRYREILETTEEGFYEVDLQGTIIACNRAATNLLGYRETEIIGMSYKALFKDSEAVYHEFNQAFKTGRPKFSVVMEMMRKDGSTATADLSVSLTYDKQGHINGFRGMGRNITERVKLEKHLKHLSLHDQLTGLNNRAYFENELARLDRSREHPIAVISADLDGLKLINDTLGHAEGDHYLQEGAEALKNALRASDILARTGGDEFVLLLPHTTQETAEELVTRIHRQVHKQNQEKTGIPLSISIGLAVSEESKHSLEDTYKQADAAMYRDKLIRGKEARSAIIAYLLTMLYGRNDLGEGTAELVQALSLQLGKDLNLNADSMADLQLLCQVYDLGKVNMPEQFTHNNLLNKTGKLTEAEREAIHRHPETGYRIASASPELSGVADLILRHHEHYDGSGYPLGLKGLEIPIECRILAVVAAYSAMISPRPYASKKEKAEALAEIKRCASSQFDPQVVEAFVKIIERSA